MEATSKSKLQIKMPAKKSAGKRPSKTKRAPGTEKRRTKKRVETFSLYIYRVLK